MFKRRSATQLQAQLASLKGNSGFGEADKGEWKLKRDNAGNGSAVIRFLPGKNDGVPFVKLVNHGFRVNGKWYIENCTSTHGDFDSCPVCQHLSAHDLYNTNKNEYDKLKRKTSFYANILVIKDPAAPENEGKVFKLRFGSKIMEKINAMVDVDPEMGETPVDVTCLWEGANFLYKTKKVGDYINYDDCKFMTPSALPKADDEEFQKFLSDNMVDLNELVAPSQFKSLEENTRKFKQVMGTSLTAGAGAGTAAADLDAQMNDFDSQMAAFDAASSQPQHTAASSMSEPAFDMGDSSSLDSELDDLLNGL